MGSLALVALGQGAPAEIERLLHLVGIETVSTDRVDDQALSIRFERADARTGIASRLVARRRGVPDEIDFPSDNPYAATSFIISCALNLTPPFITADAATFEVVRAALMAALSAADVVVEGETGTGKESLIKLIHAAGGGASAGLMRIDCRASDLPDAPLDSWASAAFDGAGGADGVQPGGSTLFFDRIDELPALEQSRLVKVMTALKERARTRMHPLRCAAAATRSLAHMADERALLPELYQHFQLTLKISPLRQRHDDILILVRHFLDSLKPGLRISPGAMRMLCDYPFPGNARELQNLATRLAILFAGETDNSITRADMLNALILGSFAGAYGASLWKLLPQGLRREVAHQALASFSGDTAAAARSLGLEPFALAHFTSTGASKVRKSRPARDA